MKIIYLTATKVLVAGALLSAVSLAGLGCAATVPPPPPAKVVVVSARPHPGALWYNGHWKWNRWRHEYVWVPGHWKMRRGHRRVVIY